MDHMVTATGIPLQPLPDAISARSMSLAVLKPDTGLVGPRCRPDAHIIHRGNHQLAQMDVPEPLGPPHPQANMPRRDSRRVKQHGHFPSIVLREPTNVEPPREKPEFGRLRLEGIKVEQHRAARTALPRPARFQGGLLCADTQCLCHQPLLSEPISAACKKYRMASDRLGLGSGWSAIH